MHCLNESLVPVALVTLILIAVALPRARGVLGALVGLVLVFVLLGGLSALGLDIPTGPTLVAAPITGRVYAAGNWLDGTGRLVWIIDVRTGSLSTIAVPFVVHRLHAVTSGPYVYVSGAYEAGKFMFALLDTPSGKVVTVSELRWSREAKSPTPREGFHAVQHFLGLSSEAGSAVTEIYRAGQRVAYVLSNVVYDAPGRHLIAPTSSQYILETQKVSEGVAVATKTRFVGTIEFYDGAANFKMVDKVEIWSKTFEKDGYARARPKIGGIVRSPSGDNAYAAISLLVSRDETDNQVVVVGTAGRKLVARIPLHAAPSGIEIDPAGARLYVSHSFAGTLSVVDTSAREVVDTIKVGRLPMGVAVDPSGHRVYVADAKSATIAVLDTDTGRVVARIGRPCPWMRQFWL